MSNNGPRRQVPKCDPGHLSTKTQSGTIPHRLVKLPNGQNFHAPVITQPIKNGKGQLLLPVPVKDNGQFCYALPGGLRGLA